MDGHHRQACGASPVCRGGDVSSVRKPGRYTMRMVVVLAVIAGVIGLGVLWRSSPAASLVRNDRRFGDGRQRHAPSPREFRSDRGRESAAGLSSIDDLGQTVFVVAAITAVVVVVDKSRRRRNPIRPSA